ncbi:hypothetical protein DOY81_012431, partial [Sarcophaga bullata]
ASAEPSSHTFTCLDSGSSGRSGATRSRGAQASPSRCPQAGQTRTIVQNSYGNKAQNMQVCSAPPPNSPGAWAPQQVHFIGDPDSSKTFRNYTDYAVTYGPLNSPSAEPSSHAFTCLDSGSSGRSGTTRSRSAQASPSRCPQAGQTRTIVQNSYDNKAQNMQIVVVVVAPDNTRSRAHKARTVALSSRCQTRYNCPEFYGNKAQNMQDSSKKFRNYTLCRDIGPLNSPSGRTSSHAFTCLDSGQCGRSWYNKIKERAQAARRVVLKLAKIVQLSEIPMYIKPRIMQDLNIYCVLNQLTKITNPQQHIQLPTNSFVYLFHLQIVMNDIITVTTRVWGVPCNGVE